MKSTKTCKQINESHLEKYISIIQSFGPHPTGSTALKNLESYLFTTLSDMSLSVSNHSWTSEGFTLAVDALVQSSGIEEYEDKGSSIRKQFNGWPNPSGPGFHMRYQLAVSGDVTLGIYDISGRLIQQFPIPSSQFPIGSVIWDGRNDLGCLVPSGIYFYQLKVGNYIETKRMVFLK